ncbi:MAG: glycosyltransferase family 2 protein [Candidatus Sungbacteria bacterium]|uniref:Glycosyltransferase family 2 protein n=1 Tax=Candidatus Sungiibacteriota bacterium TaxID=2750080 RepID=A0A932YW60_9BACT|nr:glycosyltransferase family 2 protein [Candidatus Sungbacteria bacterium]
MTVKSAYLKVGRAKDIPTHGGRVLYRALETIPGLLAWVTIAGIFVASRFLPVAASFFVIAFDIYWLFKTVFLSLHLRAGYRQMQRHLKTDWLAKLQQLKTENYNQELRTKNWHDIHHLIILPFYKESYEVMRHGLQAIAANSYPKDRMFIVLGVEERAGPDALAVAARLEHEFGGTFAKFLTVMHPADLPGELAGKGSNETFAARKAKAELIDPAGITYERVIVSSFDSDTIVPPHYFAILTYHYLTAVKPLRSSYQPIPVYSNNIWDAPAFSRVVAVSGTFWQTMQQSRPERLATFSSHSMPLAALVGMDYWHVNIVSEDSRIFWQSLLFYDGDYRVVPLYYPVYMDANVAPTLFETAKNVYRQQRRWGWGVENVPYLLYGFLNNPKVPLRRKLYFSFNQLEGFWSWATNAMIIFLLGWLPILIGSDQFNTSLLAYNLPRVTRWIMSLAMVGLVTSAYISTRLLPPRPPGHPIRKYAWMVLQWLLLPVTIMLFGSFPGLEAQTRLMLGKYMGFWFTPKYRRGITTAETGVQMRPLD